MNQLFFRKPANHFCETLLLGNGRLGAILYGGVEEDVYKLNDDTLWSGYPRSYPQNKRATLEQARDAILNNRVEEAHALMESLYGDPGQCYLPAGALRIRGAYGKVSDYRRSLSLDQAVHVTEFCTNSDSYQRTAIASHPDDLICIRYYSKRELPPLEISLDAELRHSIGYENGTLLLEGEAPGNGIPSYIRVPEHLIYSDDPAQKGMRYTVALRASTDGSVTYRNSSLWVEDGTYLELRLTVRTSFAEYGRHPYLDGIDSKAAALEILDRAESLPYQALLERHTEDHRSLFDRVQFTLEGGRPELPTDERLLAHQTKPDPGLYALLYQFGRYLMIASSRLGTQATNLQGIWNESPTPPWSSNYTVNINTQMNYWGACGANLSECCEPLHRLIYELAENGRVTAREMFGADGFCVNHNTDLWRITHPVGNWIKGTSRYSYFPLAGAWLTRHLYEYYLETKDKDFLGGKAFDAILGSARFCDSMLTSHNGRLIFTPAAAPENEYLLDGKRYAVSKSAAMLQSIVQDAFEICIACCRILDRETDYANRLEKRLAELLPLQIGEDGRIMEWDEPFEEYDPHHRHLSHLYAFYPAKTVTDKALWEACRQSLEARGDVSTGWSSVWKICLWARMGDGERAIALANQLLSYVNVEEKSGWNGGTYPNLLCACPPAQWDGNYGFVAAVHEMLAQEINGETVLLPALPALWKSGSITGLRINGRTVNIQWKNGKIVHSSIL